ncbi:MAG: type 4 fimbrial biosis protein PilM, type pilus assembly protein PilM [Candidatus Parcubacteria bacterium]|jgi:type IV pilus assembly protein PilM
MSFLENIFKHFPTPEFLSMSHVGVDISPTAIRFIGLKRTTHGLALAGFGEQLLLTVTKDFDNIHANADVVAALKKLQRTHKLSFVEVSIPEEKAYLFTTDVPVGDDASIRNNIEFHLEENVPISLSDALFEYYIINKNEKTNMLHVAVSVLPVAVAEDYIELFTSCGMTPVSFLIENQALSKAIIKKGDPNSYLVVNLGFEKTVLSVVSDDAVQFTSTVHIGSEDFTQAIMKEFNVSEQEAEKIKFEKGFSRSKDNESLFLSLINTVSALKDEINRIYVYWQAYQEKVKAQRTINSINHVILAGKDSTLIGFRDYIAMSLKVDVELANVWLNVMSFDNEIPPIEYLESLNYGTAIGLALPKKLK